MKEAKGRYMVVAVRHFINGEHHWLAPEGVEQGDDPMAFGAFERNGYYKPVFKSTKDAEDWAVSLLNGEWTLAQWEKSRPTFYVMEEAQWLAVVEKEDYKYPEEAEAWSDAKVADFEREQDCEDFVHLAVWNSETDGETISEKSMAVATALDAIDGFSAWVEKDGDDTGIVGVVDNTGDLTSDGLQDFVANMFAEGEFPCDGVEFSRADGNTAYFKVK